MAFAWHNPVQVIVSFVPQIGGDTLHIGKVYSWKNSSVQIDVMRCYLSGMRLYNDNKEVFRETVTYRLIDASDTTTLSVALQIPPHITFDSLSFTLGIDSATNVSGVMGGDLDPTKGMYWTWQSGYINMKVEGKTPLSTARLHEFQLHIGGYTWPYATVRQVGLKVDKTEQLVIGIDVFPLLQSTDFTKNNSIMVPGAAAASCANHAVAMFRILP
jgi:hypothetical protein